MIAKLFRHPVPRIIDAVLRLEIAVKTVDSIKSHLAGYFGSTHRIRNNMPIQPTFSNTYDALRIL